MLASWLMTSLRIGHCCPKILIRQMWSLFITYCLLMMVGSSVLSVVNCQHHKPSPILPVCPISTIPIGASSFAGVNLRNLCPTNLLFWHVVTYQYIYIFTNVEYYSLLVIIMFIFFLTIPHSLKDAESCSDQDPPELSPALRADHEARWDGMFESQRAKGEE